MTKTIPDRRPVLTSPSFRQSAIRAYADGLPGGVWQPPSPTIARWIALASLLQAATAMGDVAERETMLARAAARARELLGPEEAALGVYTDPPGVDSPDAPIRALVDTRSDHRVLKDHILQSLLDLHPGRSIARGRIICSRLRLAQFMGKHDLDRGYVRMLIDLGRRIGSGELLIQGWQAVMADALSRGNLPAMERSLRHLTKHAYRSDDPNLHRIAFQMQGTVHGLRGDHEKSIECFWQSFKLSRHPRARAWVLGNLAETLYRVGHYQASRAARAVCLEIVIEPSIRGVILGGYAEACAALDDEAGVRWASTQVLAIALGLPASRQLAQGLLGCARACGDMRLDDLASRLYRLGVAMAEANGYHDLRFWPDPTRRPGERRPAQPFGSVAEEATESLLAMAPHGISMDLTGLPR